jgi:hypothetical protein
VSDTSRAGEVAIWQAWERGESRCPHCIGLCPADWRATCDCFMAPEDISDHDQASCPSCIETEQMLAEIVGGNGDF